SGPWEGAPVHRRTSVFKKRVFISCSSCRAHVCSCTCCRPAEARFSSGCVPPHRAATSNRARTCPESKGAESHLDPPRPPPARLTVSISLPSSPRRAALGREVPRRRGGVPASGSCLYSTSGPTHIASPRVSAGMKPILLQGHERSITQIKYNREGDLLFTVAKDPIVNVWYSVNGERLGTYMGHTGAVWCVDADCILLAVSQPALRCSLWTWGFDKGKQLALLKTNSAVRTCGFDFGGNIIMFSTDKQMGYQCFVSFFDLRDPSQIDSNEPYMKIPCNDSKITSAVWGPLGECIIAGHESGELNQYSAKSGEVLVNVKEHSRQINDIQLSRDMTMFVTASKDNTAKLFDSTSLEHQKTFRTERPVNSAALSPNYDHVVLGGGQEAMDVTTTSTRIGKFEARFFHLAFEEEFGRVKGHFGPINSVAFHPDGKSYSSGGEDGYVRIHYFDPQYFEFEFEA
ncbi:Eukaryotic translation initiation factor 3 subunit I, partial [Lemmus lemmus]